MPRMSMIAELWDFLKHQKKWWLTPIVVVLVLLSALIIFAESSVLSPFIYTLF